MKIELPPERVFICSDYHAFHKNICRGTTTWEKGSMRDFDNEVLMTEQLAKNTNSKVGVDDILIHLGDWSFSGKDKVKIFRDMINCKNIIALKGNHDYNILKNKDLQQLFTKWYGEVDVDPIVHFTVGKHRYVCSHYSLNVWEDSHHGIRNLFGHSHNSLPDNVNSLSMDVGVDCHDLFPLSFVEVEEIISKKVWKPVDHHNEKTN
jgi:calcineurin-like phosphoesterase family protein